MAEDDVRVTVPLADGAPDSLTPDEACPYEVKPSTLNLLNADRDDELLNKLGGADGLAKALRSDLQHGLQDEGSALEGVDAHRAAYGSNALAEKEPPSLFSMLLEAAQDPMIVILLIVALVTIILGAAVPEQRAHQGWSEGLAVLGTALIVIFIGAGQDYSKELQFQKLNALKDIINVKVIRSGKQVVVPNTEVVVGDIMFLDTGDKIIADGLVIRSQGLVVDEASLTGESDPIKKEPTGDLWLRSGTTVNEGSGHMLVVAVGVNSEWGKTMLLVSEAGDDETPLQVQLTNVATQVSKMGVLVAVVCFLALFIKWLVINKGFKVDKINDNGPLQFLLYAITITVVSIPEGLPLAVTLTLAYSMKKMMKDNNFVRVLSACETMGGATAICSDKTGTLTENRMTVVEGWFCGKKWDKVPPKDALSEEVQQLLNLNCSMNSKAFLVEKPEGGAIDFVGNRTECALLVLLSKLGIDYNKTREAGAPDQIKLYGFSSARKMASVLMQHNKGTLRLYNKGAAEWVLKRCVSLLNEDGSTTPLTEAKTEEMMETITNMAKRGLRCICLTYRDYPAEDPTRSVDFFEDPDQVDNGLIAYAIVGIKDPVRAEVPDAVATCQKAGIVVRMVTGDNIHTAQQISKECGILVDDCVAMEGPVFRNMPAAELIPLLPRLRVLARSSPEDKLTLVSLLKGQGEVVAVTGDGTNDAPALKESDVGLAMGIAGTEVAKEAADIIILDDNFSSIVKSVLWGRCVFVNIRKFLVFQLSVNLVAMLSAAVGAIYGGVPPLNVLQLLWVNMIMDTLAALALATEEPYPELLDEAPHGRFEPLITQPMYVNITVAAIYKLGWLFGFLYGLPEIFDQYAVWKPSTFYPAMCPSVMTEKGWNSTSTANLCNYMSFCGFPEGGSTRQTSQCILYPAWSTQNLTIVPSDARDAVCRTWPVGYECPEYLDLKSAQGQVETAYERDMLQSYKPALSVLFNSFILAQVANAFVSRRINYELDFFRDITKAPVFLGIMGFITVLQVIIMQTPISFVFKVQPLNGPEWGVCIGVAFGAIIYSWIVRILIRLGQHLLGGRSMLAVLRGKRVADIANSASASGRFASNPGSLRGNRSGSLPGSMRNGVSGRGSRAQSGADQVRPWNGARVAPSPSPQPGGGPVKSVGAWS